MKLTAFLLTVLFVHAQATGVSQKITISGKDLTLKQIFSAIKDQTGYVLFAKKELLNNTKLVSLSAYDVLLTDLLDIVFKEQPLSYTIQDKTIILSRKSPVPSSKYMYTDQLSIEEQAFPITGVVRGTDGKGLEGINILVKGSKKGTITDAKGYFSIDVNKETVLIISSVGYETQEIKVKGVDLVITMKIVQSKLDEVTVSTGYWETTQKLSTGNISKVTSAEISKQPVGNVLTALEGRVPGLVITPTTGLPGGAIKVELRGRTSIDRSITDDQPLFIIDGVPIGANNSILNRLPSAIGQPTFGLHNSSAGGGGLSPMSMINPRDILSIEVLKDADATAIYGSRGANGVIIITTKKGSSSPTKIDFNYYKGVSAVANPVEFMNTAEYIRMRKKAFEMDGIEPTMTNAYDLLAWDTTRYTNFPEFLIRKSVPVDDAQFSVSGGSAKTSFMLNASYRKEASVAPGDYNNIRKAIHWSINHSGLNDRLKIGFNGGYTFDKNDMPMSSFTANTNMQSPPNMATYDEEGNIIWNEGGIVTDNPMAILNAKYSANTKALYGSANLNLAIIPGTLTFRSNIGYNNYFIDEISQYPLTAQNPAYSVYRYSNFSDGIFDSWLVEPQLEFTKNIHKGKLTLLMGGSWQATEKKQSVVSTYGYSSDELMYLHNGGTRNTISNLKNEYRYQAVFGRLNYNWQDKYLMNVSIRRDGSSRFGPDQLFANFGAIGAAWVFTEEKFASNTIPWINFGKLRVSYGITGNDKITDYQYLDTWRLSANMYDNLPSLYPAKLFNPYYQWEKTTKWESGIELDLLNNRLQTALVYYNHRSSNQLVQYKLPNITGFTSVVANLPALIENKGWELSLTSKNIKGKTFNWSTSANISFPKNKLISFPNLANSSYNATYVEGQSLNLIYKYKYTGVDPATGWNTVEDVDRNELFNAQDYQVLGHTDPKYFGGIENSFGFGNFTISFMVSFRKQTASNYFANINSGTPPGTIANLPKNMNQFWEKEGDIAAFQRLSTYTTGQSFRSWNFLRQSDASYSDASFARLSNVFISYKCTPSWLQKISVKEFEVYVQGQNLATITSYKNGDPLLQNFSSIPPLRVMAAGLRISL